MTVSAVMYSNMDSHSMLGFDLITVQLSKAYVESYTGTCTIEFSKGMLTLVLSSHLLEIPNDGLSLHSQECSKLIS